MENVFIDVAIAIFLIFFLVDLLMPFGYKFIDAAIKNRTFKISTAISISVLSICIMLFAAFAVYIAVADVTYAIMLIYLTILNFVITEVLWVSSCIK